MTVIAKNTNVFVATGYNINSTSYTNLLVTSGGAAVTLAYTKVSAGTRMLIRGGALYDTTAANTTMTIGINDGTTDRDLGANRVFSSNSQFTFAEGSILISGLSAGSYTFTLRGKCSAANNITFSAQSSLFITAMEVP